MKFNNGSLTNVLMSNTKNTETPHVGQGVTGIGWTDRTPYTVVQVFSSRRIVIQEDNATRADKNGMSEVQNYEFTPNPNGTKIVITLRSNGTWHESGCSSKSEAYLLGQRGKYHDFSF